MPDTNKLFLPVLAVVDTYALDFLLTLLSFSKA
jgi:hypothetical protein